MVRLEFLYHDKNQKVLEIKDSDQLNSYGDNAESFDPTYHTDPLEYLSAIIENRNLVSLPYFKEPPTKIDRYNKKVIRSFLISNKTIDW